MLVRRDIWSLEQEQPWHPVTLAYALAIGEMKRRSSVDPADPTGWTYQTQVHGQRPPPGDVWRDQCQHSTWFFLPWHRMYLFWFEQTVRSIVQGLAPIDAATKETWALPYWNYTDPRPSTAPPPLLDTLPAAYRSRLLPSGETNQLFVAQRDPAVNADPITHPVGGRLGSRVTSVTRAMAETLFSSPPQAGVPVGRFGGPQIGLHHPLSGTPGALETTPHGTVHNAVGGPGGLMTDPYTAAGDPLFWLHHCNIDRLWQVWLKMPARSNPADPEWLDREQFHFHDPAGRDVAHRVRQVVATTDLGYSYEDLSVAGVSLLEVRVPASATPSHPPEMVGASDRPMVLRGGRASVAFDMRPPVGPLAALGAARSPSVFLNLEDIQADENPGVSYAVFVNLPDDVDLTDDTFYVGNVALFGVEMARDLDRDHPGGHGLRYAFDITDLVARLRAEGRWDESRLTVTLAPLTPPPLAGLAPASTADLAPVTVGRVSVYLQ